MAEEERMRELASAANAAAVAIRDEIAFSIAMGKITRDEATGLYRARLDQIHARLEDEFRALGHGDA